MNINEQIEWLRKMIRRWHEADAPDEQVNELIAVKDTLEKLNRVYEAAKIWERDENRTDETEHNLIMAVRAAVEGE